MIIKIDENQYWFFQRFFPINNFIVYGNRSNFVVGSLTCGFTIFVIKTFLFLTRLESRSAVSDRSISDTLLRELSATSLFEGCGKVINLLNTNVSNLKPTQTQKLIDFYEYFAEYFIPAHGIASRQPSLPLHRDSGVREKPHGDLRLGGCDAPFRLDGLGDVLPIVVALGETGGGCDVCRAEEGGTPVGNGANQGGRSHQYLSDSAACPGWCGCEWFG